MNDDRTAFLRATFLRWDFLLGAGIGGGAFAGLVASESMRKHQDPVVVTLVGVSAGVLGIVAGIVTLATSLFWDDVYAAVLDHVPGGVRGAGAPYLTVAAAAAAGIIVGLATLLVQPVSPPWTTSALIGLTAGLAAWAVCGTVDLVSLTFFHGQQRANLQRGARKAREAKDRILGDRSA